MIIDVHVHPVLFGPICTDSDRVNFRKKAFGLYKSSPVPMEQVMAIGDNENDLSMFEVAGLSVAMGNANERVKASARFETLPNDAQGVAAAIRAIVFGEDVPGVIRKR